MRLWISDRGMSSVVGKGRGEMCDGSGRENRSEGGAERAGKREEKHLP